MEMDKMELWVMDRPPWECVLRIRSLLQENPSSTSLQSIWSEFQTGIEENMESWELPDQKTPQKPRFSSVIEAWKQPSNHRSTERKKHPPAFPAAKAHEQLRASSTTPEHDATRSFLLMEQASPVSCIKRRQVPKTDKATEITPSFEMMLKRAALSKKKKSMSKGFSRTRQKKRKAASTSPRQSFPKAHRKSKVLYNLYMNLYDEVGEMEAWTMQKAEGLPKACFIFSAIRNGEINVNDLLLTLHTLGILVTSEEMREALKDVDIDINGNLNFSNFLDVLNETSSFTLTETFQVIHRAFSKMRNGMIAVADLHPTLISLVVDLTFEKLQEAMAQVYVNKEGRVNISDFVMALSDLEHHYEDVDFMNAYDTLKPRKHQDEFDTDNRKEKSRRRTRFSQDIYSLPKANGRESVKSSDQKSSVQFFQEKRLSRFDFEGSQEKSWEASKRHSTHKNSLVRTTTTEELEDMEPPSAYEGDRVPQQSTTAKEVVSLALGAGEERAPDLEVAEESLANSRAAWEMVALQNTFKVVNKIKGDTTEDAELHSTLQAMGVHLTDEEFHKALKKVTLEQLKDATEATSKTESDKVAVGDLLTCMNNMGIQLSDEEFQEALKIVFVDGDGKVDFKEFLKGLTGTQQSSENIEMEEAMKAICSIKEDRVDIQQLDSIMSSRGIHLSPEEIQNALELITCKEDGKVNLEDFMMALTKCQQCSRTEKDKVNIRSLDCILDNMGIFLTHREIQEALKNITTDDSGKVNLTKFMTSVRALRKFSHGEGKEAYVGALDSILTEMGVHLTNKELQEALKYVTVDENGKVKVSDFLESMISTRRASLADRDKVHVSHLESILGRMEVFLSEQEFQEALKHTNVGVNRRVNLIEFMKAARTAQRKSRLEGEKVDVNSLDSTLANMGICLTAEELQKVLGQVTISSDGKVDLKDVMERVMSTQWPSQYDRDKVDIQHLDSILINMGVHLTNEELQEALNHMTVDADGNMNLREFMEVVETVQKLPSAEEDRTDVSNLDNIGIHLTSEEMQEALKHITDRTDGKGNLSEFTKGVRTIQKLPLSEGDRVDVSNLDSILSSLGIHLTSEEMQEALKHIAVDGDSKISLSMFMKSMMSTRRPSQANSDKVDIQHLDSILSSMRVYLINEELQEALKHMTVDEDGKVNLGEFMEGLRALQKSPTSKEDRDDVSNLDSVLTSMGVHLTKEEMQEALMPIAVDGDKVGIQHLDSILSSMGIYVTNEELQEALKHTPVDDGKVNLSELMKGLRDVQKLPPVEGEKDRVDVSNLDTILASMGIHLTSEEIQKELKHITVDGDDKISLSTFMNSMMSTQRPSQIKKKPGPNFDQTPKTDMTLKSMPKKMMLKPLPKKIRGELSAILLDRSKCKAAKNMTRNQLEAFYDAYNFFTKDSDGTIDLHELEMTTKKLGLNLTEQEAYDELAYADVDRDGKVNFLDFLTIISDTKRFIQAVAPEKGSLDSFNLVDATGILMFEVLSKLMEKSALSRRTMLEIVSYYRNKFLDCTSKKAWMVMDSFICHDKRLHKLKKHQGHQKGAASPTCAFTKVAHIPVMNNKQLESCVETLRACTSTSNSPYAQVPIFPLLPNRDGVTKTRPKKDLQKLEMQRRKKRIPSFENHFFHKRNWVHEATAFKPPDDFQERRTSLSLSPQLLDKERWLTMENLNEIRTNVKQVTDTYRQGIALQERNRILKLWQKVHGRETGLEAGNDSFYHTFSTYSWSWNICQELVTPNDLRKYDNKLYHRQHSSAFSTEAGIKDGKGREKQ
ncbi:EF-hand calcium-binding domain-containing protein 3 isoform D [Alligator mississippiensis]|uniref:EF-hand calcium-binding domain-containing protein 3 isoform D n=1 Tax=Alligator mississippiensis TaxID=8496 RepID=A0A151PBU6_ALLMI|nr:EF-hand calcium-binding domain-containing protein 3 isoform D [Alligator mississippiensis]